MRTPKSAATDSAPRADGQGRDRTALRIWKKGHVLSAEDTRAILRGGIERITVARLEPGDIGEDAAAARLAAALVPGPAAAGLRLSDPFTGRVNINAAGPGLIELDVEAIHALNAVDPGITLATLAPFARVTAGQLVGTVKVVSYAVPKSALEAACARGRGAFRLTPPRLRTAALILTTVPGQKPSLNEKGRAAVQYRLDALEVGLIEVKDVPHETGAIAHALAGVEADIALILTGSATSDLHDTAPDALRRSGGAVNRFGMPVDPGNLLFTGTLRNGRPVIGLPGCARSPAPNGADWVLERLICGLPCGDEEISRMGVGGLLKESPGRPHSRERRGP
ncbi:molybdopterin-binding protein [Tropicimonas sp. IMCC34011]|uniref:molybdopterin-binding protein n=1 Tax=Tropicimonas sp. IMCC34011 TaxID=2248759 RepID=UPI000E259AA4|nr:molybdopterin-binding protein [Tropicimonas sp. IMCC34011]